MQYTALLLPNMEPTNQKLIDLHLSLPMGIVDSAPYFFMAKETVTYLANHVISVLHTDPPHPMKGDASTCVTIDNRVYILDHYQQWYLIQQSQRAAALEEVDVYLDDSISTCQGSRSEQVKMLRHLFRTIDRVLRPNGSI